MDKLRSIQMLRGIAALSVFVFHLIGIGDRYTPVALKPLVTPLQAGVDLFFVISGFVMAYSVRNLSGPSDALVFIVRRIWRIAPLLYVLSAAFIGLAFFYGLPMDGARIANCFTILPLAHSPFDQQYALPPAWTLGFEMAFYLIVAAVVASGTNWRLPILIGAVCLVPLVFLGWTMIEFGFGVAIYWAWSKSMLQRHHFATLLVLAVVGFIALHGLPRPLAWGIPAALVFAAAVPTEPNSRALLRVGEISYSLYLGHLVTFEALAPVVAPSGLPAMMLCLGVAGLAAAWFLYEAIERPLMNYSTISIANHVRVESIVTEVSDSS